MSLLAAFQTLLMRYTGQEDIAVGTRLGDRPPAEPKPLSLSFANTLLLRTDLSGQPTFRELLARVRRVSLSAYDHRDLPFEKLVEELNPEHPFEPSPLFQVFFQLLDSPDGLSASQGLDEKRLPGPGGRVTCDLELCLWTQPYGGLRGSLVYSTDLFEAASIERLASHFETLLAGIVTDPDMKIERLPLLGKAERRQVLAEWNETQAAYRRDLCIHQLFEDQVRQTPNALAVSCGEERLTYRELNCRANQLACHLRRLGVGPDTLVGLCVERSLEMVVGLLGILKAGGAYVPLDPGYPQERLTFMLQDMQAPVLLTQQRLAERLPAHRARVVYLDSDWEAIQREESGDFASSATAENLAYVIYTSGSTGKPKGVAMPHRPLVNLIEWQLRNSPMGLGNRTLQFTTLSFDVAFQEVFAAWCSGGTLVLISEETRSNLAELPGVLADQDVDRLFLPFVALQQLAEICDFQESFPPALKEIITAGEQLQVTPAIRRMMVAIPGCTLHNQYGPSETHVATAFTLEGAPDDWPRLPPIGRPIANSHAYILDKALEPAPAGVHGELYLGGDCLARGYLNRPELTAERFIENPFHPGTRLYKTGDLARWLPTGDLEFLGRGDTQVKLRGFRIELGEIEAVLRQYPGVTQCAVALREDRPDIKRLVSYYVPTDGRSLSHSELTAYAREKLPDYMVPSTFVALKRLPQTPSGKVDRRALPAPDRARPELDAGYVPPQSAVEERLAAMWAELLGVERVGIHDNFFELGGDSLLAFRLLARIEKSFGKGLRPATAFRRPTVAQFAQGLQNPLDLEPATAILESQPGAGKPPLFLLPSLAGQAEYFQGLVKYLEPDQPILGISFPDPQRPPRPFATFEELAHWCVERIREIRPVGPYCLAGYSFSGMLAYEVARQLHETGNDVQLVAILDDGPRPKRSLSRIVRYPWLLLKNIPCWVAEDLLRTSLGGNVARLKRTIKAWARHSLGNSAGMSASRVEVERVFDVEGVAPAYRKILEDNLQLYRDYVPGPYAGRITLFRALTRPLLHTFERDLNWGELVAGGVEICDVPGNHFTLVNEPGMRIIGERLAMALGKDPSKNREPVLEAVGWAELASPTNM